MRDQGPRGDTLLVFLAGAAIGAGAVWLLTSRREALQAGFEQAMALLEEARVRLGEAVEAGREAARRESERLRRDLGAAPGEPGDSGDRA